MLGLGCMRLSTRRERDDTAGVAVIRGALDAGITFLDTADSYCLDDSDKGHNERLIARAVAEWAGDRTRITIATKGGMRRTSGAWVPDGRAKHLRESCEASRAALGQDVIDLYQLHVVDPRTALATSVRALAKLREDGWIRRVGLCNVTVSQIREAQAIVPIESAQVSLGPLDDENFRNGVAEYCRDQGIRLIGYRPLGGDRRKALARDPVLRAIANRQDATPEEIVLAWLLTLGDGVVPLPGATKPESVTSIARAANVQLGEEDRVALDERFNGALLRVPRAQRRPAHSRGDVVVVMGMPGAGKSTLARELAASGYTRLNRDQSGGRLADLVPRLDDALKEGDGRVVLDNTYPTRASRNAVIEAAWRRGAHARCIWLTTITGQAQVNAIRRMLAVHGSLPTPEEIKARSRKDTRYLLPDAQFRYERSIEPPTTEEGFETVEERAFTPDDETGDTCALILDLDDLTGTDPAVKGEVVDRYRQEGWLLFVHAWRPRVARGETTTAAIEEEFAMLRATIGQFDGAHCPHDAGPPVCWCRKPIPGSVIAFAQKNSVNLSRSIVIGGSSADRTMAERVGARYLAPEEI